jgi:5'-nucleotidase / UDP-sugar diphosphatase
MIGNLVADALKAYCKTNIALINSGAITSELKKGPITKLDVYNVYPYEDILHVVSLTGKQILTILEMSCNYDPFYPKKFLQISGINFWYDSCQSIYAKVFLKTVKINNLPLDINAIYSVVLPQFLLEGRTGFDDILEMKITVDRVVPVSTRFIIESYIQKEHDIKIGIEKRSFDVHPECRGDK